MRYFFIINPISGHTRGADYYEQIIRENMERAGAGFEIKKTESRGQAAQFAKMAALQSYDAVIAVGGDGTANEIGSALIGTQTALGLIPKGSGNGLAGELGLPREPHEACRLLLQSKPIKMDVGRVNGKVFLNLAGVGLDACVGHAFHKSQRRGRLPYFYLTVQQMCSYQAPTVEIDLPHKTFSLKTLLIVVANGRQYGAGAVIAPQAEINDGLFHVTVAPDMSIWEVAMAAPRLFSGSVDQIPGVQTLAVPSLTLRLPGPLPYHLDGEPFKDASELKFEILPQSLNLLVPPTYFDR